MMNDNLDTLPDRQLDELFAVEVAGWFREPNNKSFWRTHWPVENSIMKGYFGPEPAHAMQIHPFCADANAILAFLDAADAWSKGTVGTAIDIYAHVPSPAPKPVDVPDSEWTILKSIGHHWNESTKVPFARAAMIALLRAKHSEPTKVFAPHDGTYAVNGVLVTAKQGDQLAP